jgi:hypothetical protein
LIISLDDDSRRSFSYDEGVCSYLFIDLKENVMSLSFSSSLPNNLPSSFSRAVTPELDRRAHTDRRSQMTPMPTPERSWARHALLAGFVGALLGSTGAMAVLEQRVALSPEQTAVVDKARSAVPAMAIMAPLFDTAAFSPTAPSSTANSAPTGTESYSEDAAGVPSATYHEPPKAQPVKD